MDGSRDQSTGRSAGAVTSPVSIPAAVAIVGPDVLTGLPVTIVELSARRLVVEGPHALVADATVAVAFTLPTAEGPEVLAVGTVDGPSTGVPEGWRSALVLTQIERTDAELVAAHATRAQFRSGGSAR
jgi:hypothetical protein